MFLKKILVIGLSLAFTLLVMEALLRCGGYILQFSQQQDITKKNSPRVAILGESTTAKTLNAKKEWPALLSEKLRNENINLRLENLAEIGTSSAILLKKLMEHYQDSQPDLIIAMMGINDNPHFWLNDRFLLKKEGLRGWRIFKLVHLVWARWRSKSARIDSHSKSVASELVKKVNQGKNIHDELQIVLTRKSPLEKSLFYTQMGDLLLPHWITDRDSSERAEAFFRKAITEYVNPRAVERYLLMQIAMKSDPQNCDWTAQQILQQNVVPSDLTLFRLSTCSWDQPHTRELFSNYNTTFKLNTANASATIESYTQLIQYARQKAICIIVVQYPILSIKRLQDDLSKIDGDGRLIFVENKDNFESELRKRPWSDLFVDEFAVHFGHTTDFGNHLISENVFTHLRESLKKPICNIKPSLSAKYREE